MTDNIDERLMRLEQKIDGNRQLIDDIHKSIKLMRDQHMVLVHQSGAYFELFMLLVKLGIIDEKKHKQEYGQFQFQMNEARGYLKSAIRKSGLDLDDGI